MAKLTDKELELIRSSISDRSKTPDNVLLATLRAVLSGGMQNVDPELIRVFSDEINARGITADMLGESRKRKNTMRITELKLRRIIRKTIMEHGPFHGGHEGRGVDLPDSPPQDSRIIDWHDFKEAVMNGDYDSASEFLSEIGCDDPMDQEAFMGDATELTASQLAKEWQYRLENLQESTRRVIVESADWPQEIDDLFFEVVVQKVHEQGIADAWRSADEPGRDDPASDQIKRDITRIVQKTLSDDEFIDYGPAGDYADQNAFVNKLSHELIEELFLAPDFDPIGNYS